MSIHDGLNHQCSICGHTSKSRDALRKHLAYRHLIGMSGPVRPRMPTTKRRKANGDTSSRSAEGEDQIPASSNPSFSDPDNDMLAHSGGEDVDQNENPSVTDDTWWGKTFYIFVKTRPHIFSDKKAFTLHSVVTDACRIIPLSLTVSPNPIFLDNRCICQGKSPEFI